MSPINGCDQAVYRRPVAASEWSGANGDPLIEGQHMAKTIVPTEVQSGTTSNTMNWLV